VAKRTITDNAVRFLHTRLPIQGKNFAEGSKILLDTNLKIILLDHYNNFVETLNNEQCCKKFWYSSN